MKRSSCMAWILGGYLALTAWGVAGSPGLSRVGSLGSAVLSFGELTGFTNQYGFYAPRVGSPIRIRLQVQLSDGSTQDILLGESFSGEGRLRAHSIGSEFRNDPPPVMRRKLAESIAESAMAQFPDARQVVVCVEALHIPPLRQGEQSDTAAWQVIYRATFSTSQASAESHFGDSDTGMPVAASPSRWNR